MPALTPVLTTDTFDQWRQKDNAAYTAINNISTAPGMFVLTPPVNDQDILVYDIGANVFRNTGISALVSSIIANLAQTTSAKSYFFASLRNVF